MFQSRVPHQLWVEAFLTSVYLSNLLPSSVLPEHKSPYEVLVGKVPVYTSLRVFGCSCYPFLRPYSQNKFDPKSLHCVFIGYSEKHKGYRCLHPPSGRVYISRHVLFEESNFPYRKEYQSFLNPSNTPLLSAWQSECEKIPPPVVPVVVPEEPTRRVRLSHPQSSPNSTPSTTSIFSEDDSYSFPRPRKTP